ncbi:MAG: adenylate/guanylate cyclase domain-containing protein [Hyphomicrobiaceae bacterium]
MRSRLAYSLIVLGILAGAVLLRITDPLPVAGLRNLVFDGYQRLSPRAYDPALPIRIADIDEESLQRLGQWPWPRTALASLIQKLQAQGAAVIAFDMVMPEPDRLSPETLVARLPPGLADDRLKAEIAKLPSNDSLLAQAIAGAPVVIGFAGTERPTVPLAKPKAGFAFAGDDPAPFVPAFAGATQSLGPFSEAASGLASLNWVPEVDQVVRRLPVVVTVDGRLYPSLAAETLRVAFGASSLLVKTAGASGEESFGAATGIAAIRIGDIEVATDGSGQLWPRFTLTDRRRFLPVWKILSGEVPDDEIAGRIVLVGASAAGLLDLRSTPVDAAVPGVEVHAQAIEQMLTGAALSRPDFMTGAEVLYLLVVGGLMAFLIFRAGAAMGAALGALTIAAVGFASWSAYAHLGWLVDPVYPTLAVTLIYIASTVYLYLLTEVERRRVRNAFSRYMSPDMVAELALNPGRLKLGGETREMTLLFADVRGFTNISEGLDAEELTRFVNRLFTPLSDVILAYRGTIDKYMGDAVMAFWNAPLDDPDHAGNAARASLAMLAALDELNRMLAAEAETAGRNHRPIRLGIGLNTGTCCVGNLGSEQRFDYSVIGDDVNVASRLQDLTKDYGLEIIVGESTRRHAPDLAYLPLGTVQVRGKVAPTAIFALIGDADLARNPSFADFLAMHADLETALANGHAERAESLLDAMRGLALGGLSGHLDVLARRAGMRDAGSRPES